MKFNRDIWLSQDIHKPCPSCRSGMLQSPNNQKHVLESETGTSKEVMYMNEFLVSFHLVCSNCKETLAFTGLLKKERRFGKVQNQFERYFYYPSPHIIDIPNSLSSSISQTLLKSFELYWIDPSSCANKIRVVIELIMDDLGVIENKILNNRIKEYAKANPDIANKLLAIKWLGNEGSHSENLSKNQVLDAYELLDYIFELVYDDRIGKVNTLANDINEKFTKSRDK